MNIGAYTNLLNNPEVLKESQALELKSIIREYPFFQSARALYLKGLKNQESFRYNNELKVTAAYTNDRSVLFDFITSKSFQKNRDIHQQISEKISEHDVFEHEEIPETKAKEISKDFLINQFIEKNPKIISVKKDKETTISIPKNKTDKSLMTATLAKVYLEQKKFPQAIKAYEILSLKYPEKSGFFADQIKRIKILQKNKS